MRICKPIAILATILVICLSTAAQSKPFSSRDKAQIVQAILKRENFTESETWNSDAAENTIYLLADHLTVSALPYRKGHRFVLVTQAQIDEMKKAGIEYYRFSHFQRRKKSSVRVWFTREYLHQGQNSNGGTVIYTCWRSGKGWKLIACLGPAWTAESH